MYEKNTIIYGRSAGGFLVTAAMYELMDKVAIVYAAKPYTDVLRTTTDPKARQAVQESEEFGLVKNSNNVTDFIALAKVSPYENVPANPIVSPVVILTGGTNDSEVPASMPLRFAKRLQQNGWKNVYCRIQAGEGHFTDRDKEYAEANDGALCESIIKQINEFGQFDEVSKTSY
jgi:protease II